MSIKNGKLKKFYLILEIEECENYITEKVKYERREELSKKSKQYLEWLLDTKHYERYGTPYWSQYWSDKQWEFYDKNGFTYNEKTKHLFKKRPKNV